MHPLIPILLAFAGLMSFLALAQDVLPERIEKTLPTQEEIDAIVLIPSVEKGIGYIGGGVGVAERKALEQWARGYSLRIEMARKSGEYLGDMLVRVFDDKGETVLEARSDGPLMYVQLPTGRYAVEVAPLKPAALEPMIRDVTVVDGKTARLFFVWP
ncbi:MAG: hypothetical protein ACOZAQ_06130 [Pseudomonadota bacterium]